MIDLITLLITYAMLILIPSGIIAWLWLEVAYRFIKFRVANKLRQMEAGELLDELVHFYGLCEEVTKRRKTQHSLQNQPEEEKRE